MAAHHDVVIAGGGLVGASLALALSHHSGGQLDVLVVEGFALPDSATEPVYTPSFDARSTALSSGSMSIFDSFDIGDALRRQAATIDAIHVSDRGHFGSTLMRAADQGWPALGYVVENGWLGRVLLNAMQRAKGVSTLSPATVDNVVAIDGGAQVMVNADGGPVTIDAALLVVADGAGSRLRNALGISVTETDYRQHGIVANVSFDTAHQGCAFERFTDEGPLALLPLPDTEQGAPRASLVWTLPPQRAAALCQMGDADFLRALQRAFGYRLGRFTAVGKRDSYPLKLVEADEQIRPGVVVAGNAAHALHPVAGQGFNLALRDVWRLAEHVTRAVAHHQAPGSLPVLRRYLESQDEDQAQTVLFSDTLIRLFSNNHALLSVVRNLGLIALDVMPSAKSRFVATAAGRAPGRATGELWVGQ